MKKLLRDVFRLRGSRGPFGARRDARVREFVVTVPAPLATRATELPMPSVAVADLPTHLSARAA